MGVFREMLDDNDQLGFKKSSTVKTGSSSRIFHHRKTSFKFPRTPFPLEEISTPVIWHEQMVPDQYSLASLDWPNLPEWVRPSTIPSRSIQQFRSRFSFEDDSGTPERLRGSVESSVFWFLDGMWTRIFRENEEFSGCHTRGCIIRLGLSGVRLLLPFPSFQISPSSLVGFSYSPVSALGLSLADTGKRCDLYQFPHGHVPIPPP